VVPDEHQLQVGVVPDEHQLQVGDFATLQVNTPPSPGPPPSLEGSWKYKSKVIPTILPSQCSRSQQFHTNSFLTISLKFVTTMTDQDRTSTKQHLRGYTPL
jgi:hypothetical protein